MRLHAFVAAAGLLAASAAAYADDLFTYTEGSETLQFILPSSPIPSSADPFVFNVFLVPSQLNGVAFLDYLAFFNGSNAGDYPDTGGFLDEYFDTSGAQLFSGSPTLPTFKLGTYILFDSSSELEGALTISSVAPEPSSFILLGTGAIGVFGLTDRKLRATIRHRLNPAS